MAQGDRKSFPLEEQVDELCMLLRTGSYLTTACAYTGIAERSVYDWLREGQTENPRPWVEQFARRVQESRAHAQVANLQVVQRAAANGTWQAAAWFLERSNPQQWGLRSRHELEVKVTDETRTARDRLREVLEVIGTDLTEQSATVIELLPATEQPRASNGH